MSGVTVSLVNGLIGGAANTSDGVVGQIITGLGTGTIALLQPCKFVSLADAISQGLTAVAEPEAYAFVADFYNDAPIGSVLYLMLASNATTLISLCDKTNASGAIKLINYAIGNAGGQIRVLGVSRTPASGYTQTTPGFFDSDSNLAAPNAQALVAAMFAAHTPLRILIGARVTTPANNTIYTPNLAGLNGVGFTVGSADDYILSVALTTPGTTYVAGTYNNVPVVNITGKGSGALCKVVVTGTAITSVIPQTPGSGYNTGDTFTFAAGFDGGAAASFVGTITAGYAAGSAGMGTILAKVAATQPQVNIGRVKDGALSVSKWYIGALPIVPPANGSSSWYQQLSVLINAGYITATTYVGKAGYFVSDDPMATSNTDDYQSLANCRVIDKASIIAYQAWLNFVNSDVDLVTGGTMDPADIQDIQGQIINAMNTGLVGNISKNVKTQCIIDPTQVLTVGSTFNVAVRVTPKGYLKAIAVTLGFTF